MSFKKIRTIFWFSTLEWFEIEIKPNYLKSQENPKDSTNDLWIANGLLVESLDAPKTNTMDDGRNEINKYIRKKSARISPKICNSYKWNNH